MSHVGAANGWSAVQGVRSVAWESFPSISSTPCDCGRAWPSLNPAPLTGLSWCGHGLGKRLLVCPPIFPAMRSPGYWTKETKQSDVFLTSQTMNPALHSILQPEIANSTGHVL